MKYKNTQTDGSLLSEQIYGKLFSPDGINETQIH